jgi:peptidoglycan hydrolase-like protein with peptidoglycan-binding domain
VTSHEVLDGAPAERRRISRPVLIGAIVVAAVAVAALVSWLAFGGSGSSSASGSAGGTTLAVVTRRDLAESRTESGTLGYADSRTLSVPSAGGGQSSGGGQGAASSVASSGSGSGTVTWLAPEGSVVRRGGVLYKVDNSPVVLMYGTVPVYRALSAGIADGPDVRQLEQNLVSLGYDPGTVDEHFDSATAAAVKDWQDALGQTQTGSVAAGSIAFLPGPRRIGQETATVGSTVQSGSPVMTTTSTAQNVTVELDATDQTLAVVGRRVTVSLPDGSTVPGRIVSVGKVAQSSSSSSSSAGAAGSGSSTPSATIEVDIALLRPAPRALDQAPVDVDLTTQSASHVLAVPVTALIALLGGGYAVEVSTGGTTRLVAVTPGLYAGGYVELTRGVREGERVVVPQ